MWYNERTPKKESEKKSEKKGGKSEVNVQGFLKMTLLDFPGKVACTIFLAGCNYRCPFCHNTDLLPQGNEPFMTMEAFLESKSFEDAVRNAVSIGGDSDTIAAITGSVAEAFYGMIDAQKEKALAYLPEPLKKTVLDFERKYQAKT